ncbi:hypothetical protein JCM8097_004393 [Rhodosporidiobolus ruineniae]
MAHYAAQEDLAVYQWGGEGGESDLAHLLDDGDDQLDALTFGLDDGNDQDTFGDPVGQSNLVPLSHLTLTDPVSPPPPTSPPLGPLTPTPGKDFDFAGSTNAFLGTAGAHQAGLKPLQSTWLGKAQDAAPSQAQTAAATPSARSLSPWTSLDDDPLLSSTRKPVAALPPPVPVATQQQQQQQQQQPARAFKTLEEVEAELRAQQQQQQAPPAMTVEQVEAEMLRQRQLAAAQQAQQAQQAAAASPAPQPQQLQQQPFPNQPQQQQLPPGMSPLPAPQQLPPFVLPPQIQAHLASLGVPPGYPPHLLPPHIRAQVFPHGLPPPPPPGMFPPPPPGAGQGQGHSRPGSLAGGQFPPLGAASPAPSPVVRPAVPPQPAQASGAGAGFPQPPSGPPTPGPGFPPLGAPIPAAPVDLMATLFPPLPSAAGVAAGPPTVAGVEQQLHLLSLSAGSQHPSLTSAQLQALLQQAHAAGAGAEGEQGEEDEKKRAAEELVRKVEERILEHERMEERRKRKAGKIAAMAKHNNLMSNSDKDFITRIQVSQLVTDDPYADDFYFHIMAAIKASRGLPVPGLPLAPQQPGQPGQQGPGGGRRNRGRENAMNRMAQNVQRLVDSAKKRNANQAGAGSTLALDGALGKIATRTRSAPRPLLQVKPSSSAVPSASPAASSTTVPTTSSSPSNDQQQQQVKGPSTGQSLLKGAGLITRPADAPAQPGQGQGGLSGPLTYRATLQIVEALYDCVLDLEQLRRIQPQLHATAAGVAQQLEQLPAEVDPIRKGEVERRAEEAREAVREGEEKEMQLRERLWGEMRVMEALDACTPHPFISILSVQKGKRILPRAIRHLTPEQTLTLLTLLVATFDTLDVVRDAHLLDVLPSSSSAAAAVAAQRKAVEDKTAALLSALVPPVMAVVSQAPLRLVTGMLGLLLDRNNPALVVRSKPGLAFLTILLSRAEGIKQAHLAAPAGSVPEDQHAALEADLATWHRTFTHLFTVLSAPTAADAAPLLSVFPSTRLLASLPFGFPLPSATTGAGATSLRPESDSEDEPVWRFFASVAVCADPEQQQRLVMGVRDKVVENVRAARAVEKGTAKGVGPEVGAAKLRNVNLLLHALSLDASMIETDE